MLQLSFASIPHNDLEIPGVCFVAESEQEALAIVEIARRHYEHPGEKRDIVISFDLNDKEVDVKLVFSEVAGAVEVRGVAADNFREFVRSFERAGGLVVLAGFGDKEISTLSPNIFNIVMSRINVDGDVLNGSGRRRRSWHGLFA